MLYDNMWDSEERPANCSCCRMDTGGNHRKGCPCGAFVPVQSETQVVIIKYDDAGNYLMEFE